MTHENFRKAEPQKKAPKIATKQPSEKPQRPKLSPSRAKVFAETKVAANRVISSITKLKKPRNAKDKFADIPKEQVEKTRATMKTAIAELQKGTYKTAIDAKNIKLEDPDYYLAIAIKESCGNPNLVSPANAVGYFQLTPIAVAQTNKIFKTRFTHDGEKDGVKDSTLLNAMAGILYWHICRDISPKTYDLNIEGEQENIAAFMYNAGPRAACDFAILLKNPKNYKEFEKGLVALLGKKFPKKIKVASKEKYSQSYKVNYDSAFELSKNFEDKDTVSVKVNIAEMEKGKRGEKDKRVVKQKTHTYPARKIIEALDYARVVAAIRDSELYSQKTIATN